jgi:hypothetical protein
LANRTIREKKGWTIVVHPFFSLILLAHCFDAYLEGVWQLGKKVLAIILAACALVTLANGRKYGRF